MTKHTPGPWTVEEYGDADSPSLVIHKDGVTRVCFLATPGSHGDQAKIEADAHLIAAAPDMLAALRAASGYLLNAKIDLETGAPKRTALGTIDGGIKVVAAAIAKATGTGGAQTSGK